MEIKVVYAFNQTVTLLGFLLQKGPRWLPSQRGIEYNIMDSILMAHKLISKTCSSHIPGTLSKAGSYKTCLS